jgi:PIN domain nuclease of toxin-antitoxin system
VNLVTDTHALVWYLTGQARRLSRRAHRAFQDADRGRATVHIPVVILMEVVLLERRGRVEVAYRELREQLSVRPGLPLEPLFPEDIDEARGLRLLPDPFDCLIAATARRLGLALITCDESITETRVVRTYW